MSIGNYYFERIEYRISKRVSAENFLAKYFGSADEKIRRICLASLFGSAGQNMELGRGFHCEFGNNTYFGRDFSCGENLQIDDHAPVYIGKNVHIGNNVRIKILLTAGEEGYTAKPVYIGDDVSIDDNVVIEPGSVIGYNSIVKND